MTYDTLKGRLFKFIESELSFTLHPNQTIGDAITKACAGSGRGRAEIREDLQSLRMDLHVVHSEDSVAACVQMFLNKWAPEEKVLDVGKPPSIAPAEPDGFFRATAADMQTVQAIKPEVGLKFDTHKLNYSLIDAKALAWLAGILTYGAVKYAPNNWRKVDDWRERYYAALMRHVELWRAGERDDPETGMHHLAGALFSVMCLLAMDTTESVSEIAAKTQEAIRRWKAQLPP